jgi:dCTP deaminase
MTANCVLSDIDIERELNAENIVIHPFNNTNLANCSYDVTLGKWFYRNSATSMPFFNPWNEDHVNKFWGKPFHATSKNATYYGLPENTEYILLDPSETILAHTREFIGGRGHITTMMKARSSIGRSCIAVCKCAGWGDIGYINRWTMEITNFSDTQVVLPVGARVAQIVFMYTNTTRHQYSGKYQNVPENIQTAGDLIRYLTAAWSPDAMIPKLWRDIK